jgi:very-short-patch-repair endonuclease
MYKRAALKCAKSLRVEQTAAEKKLWSRLRNRALAGLKFRRQQPIGRYIVDFFCAEKNLVIELDGVVHLYREDQDKYRQTWLESEGFSVLRFLNTDICQNIEVVLEEVLRECDDKLRDPHPNPSPLKGEGLKSET